MYHIYAGRRPDEVRRLRLSLVTGSDLLLARQIAEDDRLGVEARRLRVVERPVTPYLQWRCSTSGFSPRRTRICGSPMRPRCASSQETTSQRQARLSCTRNRSRKPEMSVENSAVQRVGRYRL